MAGAGYKLFNTGEVLTASDVNTYLQQQTVMVFASSAARTSALSGVLAEGMVTYLQDTNSVEVYNGTAFVAVGGSSPLTTKGDLYTFSTVDARLAVGANGTTLVANSSEATGLQWVTPTSGGLTLISQYVAAADSAIDFTSISGSYKQLLLTWAGVKHSGSGSSFGLRLNADSASNYQNQGFYAVSSSFGVETDTKTSIFVGGNDYMPFGQNANSAAVHTQPAGYILIDNYSSATKAKTYYGQWCYFDGTNNRITPSFTGYYNSATAITQVNIFRNTGSDTLTNNTNTTIRLYGVS